MVTIFVFDGSQNQQFLLKAKKVNPLLYRPCFQGNPFQVILNHFRFRKSQESQELANPVTRVLGDVDNPSCFARIFILQEKIQA